MIELKVGDKVLIGNGYDTHIVTVKKVTPTGIIRLNEFEMSFNKDGRQRGIWSERSYFIRNLITAEFEVTRK